MYNELKPGSNRLISADFFTSSYRIVGKIAVPTNGAMGLLNDVNNSFAEILDARLARLHMPTKLVDRYQMVKVVKSELFAVCLARREDLGPLAVTRGGFSKISEYAVRIATPVYDLLGTLEWSGRFDFSAIMTDGTRDFLPAYDASLTAILISALKVESPAVLFNRKQIDLMALNSQRVEEV
jgi:hypothetical protein